MKVYVVKDQKKSFHLSVPYCHPQKVLRQETKEETSLWLPLFLLSLFLLSPLLNQSGYSKPVRLR